MIKHIVMWKLKDLALNCSKKENASKIKSNLEALNGKIPGLIKLEVGIDFANTESSFDVVLYSEFISKEALDSYQNHPLHKEAGSFIKDVKIDRIVVDYD